MIRIALVILSVVLILMSLCGESIGFGLGGAVVWCMAWAIHLYVSMSL